MKKILQVSLILTVLFGDGICIAQDQNKIDSLKKVLTNAKDDTTRIRELNELARNVRTQNPDTAIELNNEAIRLSQKVILNTRAGTDLWVAGQKGMGQSYHYLGLTYYGKGNYSLSLQFYTKALNAWELLEKNAPENQQLVIKNKKSRTLLNMGIVYSLQGDYPKAFEYDFKALKLAEEIGDRSDIAIKLRNIGAIYFQQGDYSKALVYFLKGLKMQEQLGNKNEIAAVLGNIGAVYDQQAIEAKSRQDTVGSDSLIAKALVYNIKVLKMQEEIGDKQVQANTLCNIGNAYGRRAIEAKPRQDIAGSDSLFTKALDYDFKALKIQKEIGDMNGISGNLNNIGSLYTSTKKYAEAEKYLLKALTISDSIGVLSTKMQIEISLSELYSGMGKDKKALEHYKKGMVLKDTLFNEEKDKEITRKEMQYDFDKKETATKAGQDKKDALVTAEITRQALIKNATLGGVAIAGIFSFLLVRSFNRRRKTDFEKQVTEVEMKALRSQMNPHFIFNSCIQ
jgi:tetratricopeptide (TPR) repeat protein